MPMAAANRLCTNKAANWALAVAWFTAVCTGDSKCKVQPGVSATGKVVCSSGAPLGICGKALSARTN
ncbi:hypothetical protein D3C72_2056930 [compost metagenome]